MCAENYRTQDCKGAEIDSENYKTVTEYHSLYDRLVDLARHETGEDENIKSTKYS